MYSSQLTLLVCVTVISVIQCKSINGPSNKIKRICGVDDTKTLIDNSRLSRVRRDADYDEDYLQGRWLKQNLTYRVLNGSRTLSKKRVEELVAKAFAEWQSHCGLRFLPKDDGKVDILISFEKSNHSNEAQGTKQMCEKFGADVYAHAYPPLHDGTTVHFNDEHDWTDFDDDDQLGQVGFYGVALHEIGHALGLNHTLIKESIMYVYNMGYRQLFKNDIMEIQKLYPKQGAINNNDKIIKTWWRRNVTVPAPTPLPKYRPRPVPKYRPRPVPKYIPRPVPRQADMVVRHMTLATSGLQHQLKDLCTIKYDTLQAIHNKIYVFKGEWVWVLINQNMLEAGPPRRWRTMFRSLPASVSVPDALYQKPNGHVVLFSGRNFWEFDGAFNLIKQGDLSAYFLPLQVSELSSVFYSNYNNKTYLIEDEWYWRFDESTQKMDDGYPKDMSAWRNIRYPVDAAIVWRGETFFFVGPRYWRFDNYAMSAHHAYPMPVASSWFNCLSTKQMKRYGHNINYSLYDNSTIYP